MKRYDLVYHSMVANENGDYTYYDEAAAIERQRDRAVAILKRLMDSHGIEYRSACVDAWELLEEIEKEKEA